MNKKPIYLDMQATTPIDFRVADAMLPLLTSKFGNPHSNSHYLGWVLLNLYFNMIIKILYFFFIKNEKFFIFFYVIISIYI